MATKAMSEMTDAEILEAAKYWLAVRNRGPAWETQQALILANQYDAELTRRNERKTT